MDEREIEKTFIQLLIGFMAGRLLDPEGEWSLARGMLYIGPFMSMWFAGGIIGAVILLTGPISGVTVHAQVLWVLFLMAPFTYVIATAPRWKRRNARAVAKEQARLDVQNARRQH